MTDFSLAAYQHQDFEPVVELLRATLPQEAISQAGFARRVLLDPNFDPNGALVARNQANSVVGFVLALVRRRALEDALPDDERGWITLFGVAERARQQGMGTMLLQAAEDWLRAQGRREVWISPYAPNYWTPGVEESAYAVGLDFLHRRGYVTAYRPLSMDASLVNWERPAWIRQKMVEQVKQGVKSRHFRPNAAGKALDFLSREFPGDWQRYIREAMLDMTAGKRPHEELRLVFQENRVIGFAHCQGERFGPFGVAKAWRGKGLGAVLLYVTLAEMRERGLHNAWFLWTDDNTAERLYKPAGFRETRRYSVLYKNLEI